MRIVGHGLDLIELLRVRRHLAAPEDDWLLTVFSGAEREGADPEPRREEYFAGRYAAKEAVAKALGTGLSGDVAWLDIEILRHGIGAPIIRLSGGAAATAATLGISAWFVSITHTAEYAAASVIAVSD